MIVTFSGVDVDKTSMTFTFDGVLIPSNVANATYDDTKKTLKFLITSAMTSKPGHKKILLNEQSSADAFAVRRGQKIKRGKPSVFTGK